MIDHSMAVTGTGIHETKRIEAARFEGEESSLRCNRTCFFC